MASLTGPLGYVAALVAAGGLAARAGAQEPLPSREYVYAGSRLLAVTGPLASLAPGEGVVVASEGDGVARVPLVLRTPSGAPLPTGASVTWTARPQTALEGEDFAAGASGRLDLPAGSTHGARFEIAVPLVDDARLEVPERLEVVLGTPVALVLHADRVEVEIRDDDLPSVSVASTRAEEPPRWTPTGEPGFAVFEVSLSGWVGPVSVRYATEDDTARAGEDYVATSGTLSFTDPTLLGSRNSAKVRVPILNDTLVEGWERFRLVLSSPIGAVLRPGAERADAWIEDDELLPVPPFPGSGPTRRTLPR
jgi:hypothetical protein